MRAANTVFGIYKSLGLASGFLQGKGTDFLPTPDEFQRTLEGFVPISDRFDIFTCCDSLRSKVKFGISNSTDSVTYYLGLPNERVIHMNSTYEDMGKFSSLNADLMKLIGAIRSTLIKFGPLQQNRDSRSEQVFRFEDVER